MKNYDQPKEIAIYGGSFDPPTLGHAAVVSACKGLDWLDQIWVMPSAQRMDKSIGTNHHHRIKMLETGFGLQANQEGKICVSRFEIDEVPAPTRTWQTVEALKTKFPSLNFHFVFGIDAFESIETWQKGQELKNNLSFIVAGRDGKQAAREENVIPIFTEEKYLGVSSTLVRNKIKDGRDVLDLIDPMVYEYIIANGLYLYATKASMIDLVDTHAHIHFDDYGLDPDEVLESAKKAGVGGVILVGTDVETSKQGVEFARSRSSIWAAVGVHPHYAKDFTEDKLRQIRNLATNEKAVAIGECGLDYHYENSLRQAQKDMLEHHLQLASEFGLPVIFHVRDAHDDFWPILDNFDGIRGVMHSFSATEKELNQALKRGLYIGLNGIMTFTKDEAQLSAAKMVPADKLVLETDAPYLTPKPFRGKICKPEHVSLTAEFLAVLRKEQLEDLARQSTQNAKQLFGL